MLQCNRVGKVVRQSTLVESQYVAVFVINSWFLYFLYISRLYCCNATFVLDGGNVLVIFKLIAGKNVFGETGIFQ